MKRLWSPPQPKPLRMRLPPVTDAGASCCACGLPFMCAGDCRCMEFVCGRGCASFAVGPMSACDTVLWAWLWGRLVLLGILICYLVAAIIEFRSWTNTNAGQAYSVWPTWGWICALVASILWLLAASAASCAQPERQRGCAIQPDTYPWMVSIHCFAQACRMSVTGRFAQAFVIRYMRPDVQLVQVLHLGSS